MPTHDFWSRVEPGEECPAGDCPECSALVRLAKPLTADPADMTSTAKTISKADALAALGLEVDDLARAHIALDDGLALGGFSPAYASLYRDASRRFRAAFESEGRTNG